MIEAMYRTRRAKGFLRNKMNAQNNSVIISESSPQPICKGAPVTNNRKTKKTTKTYYESSLKHIQQSTKKWEAILGKKRAKKAKRKKGIAAASMLEKKDPRLQDSVIILSDNESESKCQHDQTSSSAVKYESLCQTDGKESTELAWEPLRDLSETGKQFQRWFPSSTNDSKSRENKIIPSTSRAKKRKFKELMDMNSSCMIIHDGAGSDSENMSINVEYENIAPLSEPKSQATDDIIVVWSSTENSSLMSQLGQQDQTGLGEPVNHKAKERLFMIDCSPNSKNLQCLTSDVRPQAKKRNADTTRGIMDETDGLLFSKPGLVLPRGPNEFAVTENGAQGSAVNRDIDREPDAFSRYTLGSSTSTGVLPPPQAPSYQEGMLREIIIDGNNIAMAHSQGKSFSETGLQLVINYFKGRGHTVKAFVPQYRRAICHPLLERLYTEGTVIFTPSRNIRGRRITPYDDRFILQYATVSGGVVISLDQYRDLYSEKPEWRDTIENRLLAPTFVGDYVMFPEDPLGRNGPTLDQFLKF